ncbi:hypothetical protein RUM43_003770 [Polyplax serrata]|uniref:C3H1-type domain-containing protein n=1 Tax=Polyplax serrata TaxID=468196 RepID=A0AAN8S6M2_POLSC
MAYNLFLFLLPASDNSQMGCRISELKKSCEGNHQPHGRNGICFENERIKHENYLDVICSQKNENDETSLGGEDSSYDSDFEVEESKSHQDVSRTVSDTLAAEYSEYVSAQGVNTSNYTAKVEFGLKLGYTEKLVQAALCKLGPNPSQNELLAELIKLGAQSPKFTDLDGEDAEAEGTVEESCVKRRAIVIDGSNVAMSHGNKEVFSCRGIQICVDWFRSRGHREITVFVPKWRKEGSRPDNPISDQEILTELEKERVVVFTPSRLMGGKRTICYDDRYILRLASELDGIVVSNDNYRDLAQESAEFRKIVEERTLMYSFVNDRFMPPDDPLGRSGPTLDNFLKVQHRKSDPAPLCPYGKKCTYGNKCKYHHPERGSMPHKSVSDRLVEHAQKHWQARGNKESIGMNQLKGKSLSVPLSTTDDQTKQQHGAVRKIPLSRTKSSVPGCPVASCATDEEKADKSKCGENMMNERLGTPSNRTHSPYWRPLNTSDWQYAQMLSQGSSHSAVGHRLSDPEPSQGEMPGNLHRKLERQLTLNPYDHRMYWEHQSVTRISSAPDSYIPVPPGLGVHPQIHRHSSTSDSQINLCGPDSAVQSDILGSRSWVPAHSSVVYPSGAVGLSTQASHMDSYSKEEVRRKLHYHLSSIFPEEQVRTALQLYPNETKPQEICAAILALFPKP